MGVLADLHPPDRPMTVLLEREEPVAVIRLNRPEALNALSNQLMSQLVGALENLDDDEAVRCIVLAHAPWVQTESLSERTRIRRPSAS